MARLIDADALEIKCEYGYNDDGLVLIPMRDVNKSIKNAPAVEAVPVGELIALRDLLYETDRIAMSWLKMLNQLLGKYRKEGGDNAVD